MTSCRKTTLTAARLSRSLLQLILLLLPLATRDVWASLGGGRRLLPQSPTAGDEIAALSAIADQLATALAQPSSTEPSSTEGASSEGVAAQDTPDQDSSASHFPATAYGTSDSATGNNILQLHNEYRSAHRSPPLSWSIALVSSAQAWANSLASGCAFYHSGTQGMGENLAAGYNSWFEVANAWHQEIYQYSYANPGFSEATGHATQMVWAATREVGCATAASVAGCWQRTVYVCHYNPPGNVMGHFQENVMPS